MDKKDKTNEEIHEEMSEKLTEYSDRQIIITLMNELSKKDFEKLLIKLKEDWG